MPSLPQTGVWCARGRGKERKWTRVELTSKIVAAAKMYLSMPPAAVMMMIGWWERCKKSSENRSNCERAAQLCNMHESNETCAKMQSLRIMVQ